jgi:hypothetical protein
MDRVLKTLASALNGAAEAWSAGIRAASRPATARDEGTAIEALSMLHP